MISRIVRSAVPSFLRLPILAATCTALVALAACGTKGTQQAVTPTTGEFPPNFLDFATQLDSALVLGDSDLTNMTQFGDWSCPNNYFPAAGPNCKQAANEEGVEAVAIAAFGSEGEIYDAPSFRRYVMDWTYDAVRESTDEFGGGAPRVYATADMREDFEEYQDGEQGTYGIVATRIAESSTSAGPQREVLTFIVAGGAQGWQITYLIQSPVDFLDPQSDAAEDTFVAWKRWTREAPDGEPASRWKDDRGQRRLALLDSSGALSIALADGSLSQAQAAVCGGNTTGSKAALAWSRDAEVIAVPCAGDGRAFALEVHRGDDLRQLTLIENVNSYVWSPDGHRIAYQTLDATSGSLAGTVRVRDPDSGEDTLVFANAVLLDWLHSDVILLGLNPRSVSGTYFETYDANLYDLTTAAAERVERFDNQQQFWMAPRKDKAIVLGGPLNRKEGPGVQLGVYDVATHQETSLPGLAIAYPSSGIPAQNIVVSPTGDRFVWADWVSFPVAISQASLDGSHATLLDRVPPTEAISSDGLVFYRAEVEGGTSRLTLLDTLTGAQTTWPDAIAAAIAPARE